MNRNLIEEDNLIENLMLEPEEEEIPLPPPEEFTEDTFGASKDDICPECGEQKPLEEVFSGTNTQARRTPLP